MFPFSFRRAAASALAATFLLLTACGRTAPAPAEPDAVPAIPTPPADSVTVLIPAEQADVLSSVDGASVLRSYALLHAVAAEIPADALPALSAAADVTVAAVFTAPLADTEAADAVLHADDLVYRAADPTVGDGTVIAVIDSAFDADHPAFTLPAGASPAITEEIFADLVFDTNAAVISLTEKKTEEDVLALRLSDKIPFAYDYAGRDGDVSSARADHGTHVAALAAGGGVKPGTLPGAAPAAQLLLMKVFDDRGGSCNEADLLAAIEDAVLLGADVINLSLGVPAAGRSALSMTYLARAIGEAEAAGVTVVAAAGNDGASGRGGLHSDLMHTGNPDTGLPSEPAVYGNVLGVGASLNGVEYAPFITLAGGDRIRYTVTAEETAGTAPGFASALGGKSLPVIAVPGVGTPEDFARVDVRDAIALVVRGEITFAEKISHAEAAGAVGVIVCNTADGEDFRMSAPGASLPAVSVSHEEGEALAALDGGKITVSPVLAAFPAAGGDAIADFSARGPAADLTLSPEITAVGDNVLSAVSGGGYGVMSGTSMAAPQIAGLAAAYIARNADTLSALQESERAAAVRAALMSAAVPVFEPDSGLPYSPRMQGAGRLAAGADPAKMTVTVTDGEGRAAVSLGDHLPGEGGSVRFTVRIENTGAETETLTLSARLTAEGYTEQGGKTYVTETPVAAPAEITFSRKTVTLRPGETASVTVTVTPDPAFLTAQDAVFLNGFYLEGTVTAARADGTAFSLPFFGFCGDFDAAPMLDGGDWDGYESYYGLQTLYLVNRDTSRRTAGEESAFFAFSPNGDGIADSVEWEIYPLRHIAGVQMQIFDAAGEEVCVDAAGGIMKSYVSEGTLLGHRLPIWDGTDGLNSHFVWPDGQYTVRLTLRSFSGKTETAEIPLRIDTEAPEIILTETDGQLTAAATDAGTLCALRIWAPDPEDPDGTLTEAKSARRASAVSLSAKIPEDAAYLYVRAEDMAGNVTVLRYYTDTAAETEEEAAA